MKLLLNAVGRRLDILAGVTSGTPAAPTTVSVSGPSAITVGTPATFTYDLDHPVVSGTVSIVPSVTGFASGTTFGTNPIVITVGNSSGTTTVDAGTAASGTVTGTATPTLTMVPESVVSSAPGSIQAPNAFRAAPNGTTGSVLAWADVPGATSYSVQRSPDGTTWTTIGTSPTGWTPAGTVATAPLYQDTGLTANTTYHYRVAAVDGGGTGSYSTAQAITTRAVSTLGGRTLLTPANFTYIGSFAMPDTVGLADGSSQVTQFNTGAISLRYVGGVPRMLATTEQIYAGFNSGFGLYEVAIPDDSALLPGPLTGGQSFPVATIVKEWGNVWGGRAWTYFDSPYGWNNQLTGGQGTTLRGIRWDATDSRLYFCYGSNYGSSSEQDDPSFGFVTLDDGASTFASYGPWRTGTSKRDEGGMVVIPPWFATAYLGGRRLAVGFGGTYSLITAGNGGYGPGLDALAPPSPGVYNPTITLSIVGGTPTTGTITYGVLGSVGLTTPLTVVIPWNASASTAQAAFDATLGAGSTTVTGGPLPGTPIAFAVSVPFTFFEGSPTSTLDAGTPSLSGNNFDTFSPTPSMLGLMAYPHNGDTGPRDTDYENRQPALMAYGTFSAVSASGGIGGRPTCTVQRSDTDGACASRRFAGNTLQLVSGPGAGQTKLVLDHDAASQTVTPDSAWSVQPVAGSTKFAIWLGGYHPTVHAPASIGATSLLVSSNRNPQINDFADGTFVGSNLWIVSGTGAVQGPYAMTGYTFNSSTGIATVALGSGISAAVDATSEVTFDGPQRWGLCRAASGSTIQLATSAEPIPDNYVESALDYHVKMITGLAAGEEHLIGSYDGPTREATLNNPWVVVPAPGDAYIIRRVGFGGITDDYNLTTVRGYQAFFDLYQGSGCWVDTGTLHGMIMGAVWGVGQTMYDCSQADAEAFKHVIQCFDPADLAAVAGGSKAANTVDSSWDWYHQWPEYTYPIFPTSGDPPQAAAPVQVPPGMEFDATTGRLYLHCPFASTTNVLTAQGLVMVYQIN